MAITRTSTLDKNPEFDSKLTGWWIYIFARCIDQPTSSYACVHFSSCLYSIGNYYYTIIIIATTYLTPKNNFSAFRNVLFIRYKFIICTANFIAMILPILLNKFVQFLIFMIRHLKYVEQVRINDYCILWRTVIYTAKLHKWNLIIISDHYSFNSLLHTPLQSYSTLVPSLMNLAPVPLL